MRCPSVIEDEKNRLLALAEYGLSEETVLPDLEPVVHIAARMLDMPVAAVNMIGTSHVFFAASVGIGECDMRRDVSFCAHAITQDDVMVVLDATLDPRFHDNPLVTGPSGIRFYAGMPLHSPSGHALGALCVIDSRPHSFFSQQDRERLKDLARLASDKLELRRLENARKDGPFPFEEIAKTSPTAILGFDGSRRITFWNRTTAKLFGYTSTEIVGRSLDTIIPNLDGHPLLDMIDNILHAGRPGVGGSVQEVLALRKDGSAIAIEMSLLSWTQEGRQHFGAIMTDLTERRQQEDEIYRLANFDSVTGLANRGLLHRRVVDELASGSPLSVIAIDLDNFKDVNDTLGDTVGDEILRLLSERMLRSVRPVDTVSRTGGDEFAILLPQVGDPLRSASVAEAVIAAISGPLEVSDHELRIAASCGVAISPAHGRRPRS